MAKSKISKGEKAILDMGYNISLPVNLNILLTQSERDVLNIIRHRINVKHPHISMSLFSLMTGLSEGTIRRARDSLLDMGIIEASEEGISIGKAYKVKYDILMPMITALNEEKNPVKRLKLADKLRGKGRETHQKLIEKFQSSEFNF
jgi:DNA-binding transcriptional ArsR family regulator